jgi:pimeloyl-ACP methyl ester carboxylesterase
MSRHALAVAGAAATFLAAAYPALAQPTPSPASPLAASPSPAAPQPPAGQAPRLVMTETMLPSPGTSETIFVREKHPAGARKFDADHTVVFVHGATYPASTAFDLPLGGMSWMDYIARQGFDVYSIDLPGYGHASRPAAMDGAADAGKPVEDTAQAVTDYAAVADWVMQRRHLRKLDVVGWSWGTTIAGGYAAAHPDTVNRLVLYAPVWLPLPGSPAVSADTSKIGAYRLVTADAAKSRWLNGVPADKQADLIPGGWFDTWQRATWATDPKAAGGNPPSLRAPNGVSLDFVRYWAQGHATYDPAAITAPTLMIQAEWDHDTPPPRSQGLFPLLTHAAWKEYVLIGEGTHTVMMEKNRMQLFDAVQHFLESRGPRDRVQFAGRP